jgi:Tol biopolymer transport system component
VPGRPFGRFARKQYNIEEDAVSRSHHFERHLSIISTTQAGEQGNDRGSYGPSFSASGRYVTFESFSSNLAPGDTNGTIDVFKKDLRTDELTLVSTNADGELANDGSQSLGISANGRYVLFGSSADNLVAHDDNGVRDIFVKDTRTSEVSLVSADAAGQVGQGGESFGASISANGRYVVFNSQAKNLVPGDINHYNNVFLKDLKTGHVTLVSADAEGHPGIGPGSAYDGASFGGTIAADGRYAGFTSGAENLLPHDANNATDVFIKNLRTGEVALASTDGQGHQGNAWSGDAALSADGRYVAFRSWASNFVAGDDNQDADIFVKDMCTGQLTLVSGDAEGHVGNGQSVDASISPNGRYVAFASGASNLVAGDTNGITDIFVRDMHTGSLKLISVGPHGEASDFQSVGPQVSDTGDVVFASGARNLVEDDANSVSSFYPYDIFLWA